MADVQDTPKKAAQSAPKTAPRKRRSPTPLERSARSHKNRVLLRLGLRVDDLDPMTAEYLTAWSLARALIVFATNTRTRVSALNSEQKALALLEARLALRSQSDPLTDLAAQGKAIRERREQAGS